MVPEKSITLSKEGITLQIFHLLWSLTVRAMNWEFRQNEQIWVPFQPMQITIHSNTLTWAKNGGMMAFCVQGLRRSHCTFLTYLLSELSCSALQKTSTDNVPAYCVKCCLKVSVTVHGIRVHEELFHWQGKTWGNQTQKKSKTLFPLVYLREFKALDQSNGGWLLPVWWPKYNLSDPALGM